MTDNQNFMEPLEPRITSETVEADSKGIRKGKNPQFRFTVDALYGCNVFRHPKDKHVADLIYGMSEPDAKGRTYGDRRLSNQCNGTKSFIEKEEAFWYEAGCRGFGVEFMSCFSPAEFVRLSMWQLVEKAQTSGSFLRWEIIDPVLTLQILAAGQTDRQPAELELQQITNSRATALHGESPVRFFYVEERDTFKLGSPFKLTVKNLRQDEDLLVFEYSLHPYKTDRNATSTYRGQHMPYFLRAGSSQFAYVTDHEENERLHFGSRGDLEGAHGFGVLTFPMGSNAGPELKKILGKGLVESEQFSQFVAAVRRLLSSDPKAALNLVEYSLVH